MTKASEEQLIEKFETLEEAMCECCEFTTPNLYETSGGIGLEGPFFLCEVCDSTHASNTVIYPDQEKSNNDVMQMLAFCTNTILKAIAEK